MEYCQIHKPDIVLMDIRMPIMNGYEATETIKNENPEIIIFAVSASVVEEKITRIFDCGCSEYIVKPFRKAELLEKLQKYLDVSSAQQNLISDVEAPNEEEPFEFSIDEMEKNDIKDFVDIGDFEGLKEYLYQRIEQDVNNNARSLKKLAGLAENYSEDEILELLN